MIRVVLGGRIFRVCFSVLVWAVGILAFLALILYLVDSDLVKIIIRVDLVAARLLLICSFFVSLRAFLFHKRDIITSRRRNISFSVSGVMTILALTILVIEQTDYTKQDIAFDNAGTTLRGSLYLPDAFDKHPAVAIVHGSPCAPRSLYHVWADHLASDGIAVLSFDKRGTGQSDGHCVKDNNASRENLTLLANDVVAALEFLKEHPNVDTDRLGLWALSQGGWIAPIAAEKFSELQFMVIVSGPTVSVGEENLYSSLTGDGHSTPTGSLTMEQIEAIIDTATARGLDPYPVLSGLSLPTLWIHGGRDLSIPVKKSVEIIETLKSRGNPFEYYIYPNARHAIIEMTFPYDFSEGFQQRVSEWIMSQ